MCRNHSHIAAEHIGVGPWPLGSATVLRMRQPLTVQFESGEEWIKPSGSLLWMPQSQPDGFAALARLATAGYFIFSSSKLASEWTPTPGVLTKVMLFSGTGLTPYALTDTSALSEEELNDVPF